MSMMAIKITLYKRDRIDMGKSSSTQPIIILTIKILRKGRVQLVFLFIIKKVTEMDFGNPMISNWR